MRVYAEAVKQPIIHAKNGNVRIIGPLRLHLLAFQVSNKVRWLPVCRTCSTTRAQI